MQKPDIKLILGKTGSGKTIKALNLIKSHKRVLIFDTLGHDYTDGIIFYDLDQLKKFWLKVYRGNFRIIYRPLNDQPEFKEICKLVYKCGNMTLLVEELDLFCRPNQTPIEVQTILKRGRHYDIRFIGLSQRPFGIDRTITSQSNEIYVFRTDEPRDVQYLRERLGDGVEVKLKQLQQYEYVLKTDHSTDFITGKDQL